MNELSDKLERLSPRQKRELLAKLSERHRTRPGLHPLSFAQERLWFLDRLAPGSPFYNQSLSMQFSAPVVPEAFESAINHIVARHGSLRTTFHSEDGRPMQRVAPSLKVPLKVIDLSDLPEPERRAASLEIAQNEAREPFDLAVGPLIRTTLAKLAESDFLFLLSLHHIISDGWSLGVFFAELGQFYEALLKGEPLPEEPLALQYTDFAAWQRKWMAGGTLGREVEWWRERLQGLSTLQIPHDRPRPADPGFKGSILAVEISPQLTAGLRALAREEAATLFMVVFAAFQALLARWSGQTDIVVGVPVANRPRAELEGLIGFFVNTLVMRSDFSGDPSFREAVRRVRETALGAYAHQDVPFERLVEVLRPERDPSRNPLFQITFQLLDAAGFTPPQGAANAQPFLVQRGTSNVDLAFDVFEIGDRLQGVFEYSSELFEEATVGRLAEQFKLLLESAVSDPDQTLSRLNVLTPSDRRLLADWNASEAEFPRHLTLDRLIDAQAEKTPEAPALRFGQENLTYRELEVRAEGFAYRLSALGIRPGGRVALCLERSLDMVPALLGTLKAGAAYVPVDPSLPRDRIAYLVEDAGVSAVVTQRRWTDLFQDLAAGAPLLILDGEAGEEAAPRPAARPSEPLALAAILYTSGSTGRPKGVALSHRALVNQMGWIQRRFPLAPGDRSLQKYSLSFDAALVEIFAPLVSGAELVLARPDGHLDPGHLVELARRHGVCLIDVVPSLLDALLDHGGLADCDRLRWILCGGEELPAKLKDRCLGAIDAELYNVYGPAEAAVTSTWSRCSVEDSSARTPIGRPVDNMKAHVLDLWLNPVPIGVAGELYLSGEGLAQGYWRKPALTAERFLPNPFDARPGDRIYRTGDLARWRADGRLEFLGRTDSQIKLRGFRIELGEIEAALKDHPGVRDAAVSLDSGGRAGEDSPTQERLVAYYTAPRALDAAELRRRLSALLPDFMVPALYAHVRALPRTGSGKLDRPALSGLQSGAVAAGSRNFVAPRDELEQRIAQIWSRVLDVERVGAEENFFDLGGHSLLLVRLQHELNLAFEVPIPVVDLFRHPTVASQAARLRGPAEDDENPPANAQLRARAEKQREALNRRRQAHGGTSP